MVSDYIDAISGNINESNYKYYLLVNNQEEQNTKAMKVYKFMRNKMTLNIDNKQIEADARAIIEKALQDIIK